MRRSFSILILTLSVVTFCSLPLEAAEYAGESTSPASSVIPQVPSTVVAPAVAPATESTRTDRVPEEIPSAVQPVNIPDLSGDWCGSWQSCVNGHQGPMRATFCRLCDGNYRVTFVGRFFKLIPFRYSTTLNVTGYSDGVVYLQGSHQLGPIFGTFSYNAWATHCQFASGYCSKKDQGQFNLSR